MTTATNPAGPWKPLHRMTTEPGWDDCCPFWDDDGQGYFLGTHFADNCKAWLCKLTPDGRDIISESRVLINEGSHREANKLYKINSTYYHLFSEHKPGVGRYVMMQRADKITGPYTERRQLSQAQLQFHEPNQGGLVQAPSGDWFFFTHHGDGSWEGRPASLLPVTWVDGWPVLGNVGPDGLGTMVWSARKPVQNGPLFVPQTDDDFSSPRLGVQWEWNYQPRGGKWSLSERSGWLRLHAWKPLRPGDLKAAGNTLTQRVMRTQHNVVTVELDPSGMADGQVAGLCHYDRNYATIAVRRESGVLAIESARNQTIMPGPTLTGKPLWLRSEWDLDGRCRLLQHRRQDLCVARRALPVRLGRLPRRAPRPLLLQQFRRSRVCGLRHLYLSLRLIPFSLIPMSFPLPFIFAAGLLASCGSSLAAATPQPFGRPLIPDMVADASIVDIDGVFYFYATTDGWGRGLETSGTPVVWKSRDFVNWSFEGSIFPNNFDAKYWAPSAPVKCDGRYYLFPTLDGKITAAVSHSLSGPFHTLDGKDFFPGSGWSPFPIPQKSAIDAEIFRDDDGQFYMFYSRRRMVKLKPNLSGPDGPVVTRHGRNQLLRRPHSF